MSETAEKARPVRTVTALAQLGKLKLYQIWIGPVLAGSLLAGHGMLDVRSAVLCLLFLVTVAFTMCASHAFDDITGFSDGSDIRNYAPERKRSQVKPLVRGTLTVGTAKVFAYSSVALASVCVLVFWAVAGFEPWWVLAGGLVVAIFGAQYSAGINFSYRIFGGGEALTGITLAGSVWLPYGAATGSVSAAALVEGLLFGLWLVQVLICSNTVDAEDDRRVNRHTVAARTSKRGNLVFVVGTFVTSWALAVAATVAGVLGPWTPLGLLPAWLLQFYVLRNGLRGQWRNRRNYGFLALQFAVLGSVVVNVVS
ncbi:prenyltransferase [Amycolatopsis nigrescens]|uniref:prenyltransferase n=1 Tax=Amycolatopsis nigrescens TaxID=381445 RepID=UPI00037897AE|nr:prenyltransferase [Amycolatopsis nigrescens]